ncbi:hypothetical protein NM688_g3409 [Phlebia brevispora]|uniref:Uncharacterized protein n=1 Tax=Phlebia brevispora TaxID=194682 RepID=A0ACC1T6H5_9APHY|nr:hypothetical protein NM688_g3409 [Phlebia brevispora]
MASLIEKLVSTYPEQNPFTIDPPVPNLTPVESPDVLKKITLEAIPTALETARRTALNPFMSLYGDNPLEAAEGVAGRNAPPLTSYVQPPPLPQLTVENLEFLTKLNPTGRTPVYKVRIDDTVYALKMFRDKDPDQEYIKEEVGWPMFRFRRESEAYAHLLHYGACDRGVVPRCYGWFELSDADIQRCYALPPSEDDPEYLVQLRNAADIKRWGPDYPYIEPTLLDDRRPPKALLLEYLSDAQQVSISNVTPKIAEAALRALYEIHASLVWIDFDESTCGSEKFFKKKLTRSALLFELAQGWSLFYQSLETKATCSPWSKADADSGKPTRHSPDKALAPVWRMGKALRYFELCLSCVLTDQLGKGSPLLYLQLPSQPLVIVNSVRDALNLMDKRSYIYSDKPQSVMDEIVGWNWILPSAPYGQTWRHVRRYFHQHFHAGVVHRYRDVQLREVQAYLRRVLEVDGGKASLDSVNHLFSAIILDIIYGIKVTGLDDPILSIIQQAAISFSEMKMPGAFLVDTFPILRHIPSWVPGVTFRKYGIIHRPKAAAMKDLPFSKTREDITSGIAASSVALRLIETLEKRYKGTDLYAEHEEYVKAAAGSGYGAAVETSYTTTGWFILAMALHPHVQQKAQDELDRVIGQDRLPVHEDFGSLHYIQAVFRETLRWMPALPFGVPHRVMVEDDYLGFRIPEGSMIVPNIWSMSHDVEDYTNPEAYDPDRFCKNGRIDPDVRDPATYVFGFGRRICPGRYFAQDNLLLTFASILAVFNIRAALGEDGRPVHLSPESAASGEGLFYHPERLDCVFVPRSARIVEVLNKDA